MPSHQVQTCSCDCFELKMAEQKLITFDENYKIRLLDSEKYDASKSFRDDCVEFDARVDEFRDMATTYADRLEKAARCIEAEKLRAIGLRNRVAALREEGETTRAEQERLKNEKQKELDSLMMEEKSLKLVVDEQEAQIARLQGLAAV